MVPAFVLKLFLTEKNFVRLDYSCPLFLSRYMWNVFLSRPVFPRNSGIRKSGEQLRTPDGGKHLPACLSACTRVTFSGRLPATPHQQDIQTRSFRNHPFWARAVQHFRKKSPPSGGIRQSGIQSFQHVLSFYVLIVYLYHH